MAVACRRQIVEAVTAALEGIAGIEALMVELDRTADVTEEETPLLVVYEGDTPEVEYMTGIEIWRPQLDIEAWATGATMAEAGALADSLRAKAYDALAADPTLGGKAWDVRPAEEPAPQRLQLSAAAPGKGLVLSVVVTYANRMGDSFSFA